MNPNRIMFVYHNVLTGEIRTEWLDGTVWTEKSVDWELVATMDPRLWIQAHFATIEAIQEKGGD